MKYKNYLGEDLVILSLHFRHSTSPADRGSGQSEATCSSDLHESQHYPVRCLHHSHIPAVTASMLVLALLCAIAHAVSNPITV